MSFNFNNDTPIYLQIIECVKNKIISKEYKPNERLPSVRELSLMFEVNPNTIQKALFELENMGLVKTERTNGKFVTDDEKLIEKTKKETIKNFVDEFYQSMQKLGINKNEILDILKESKK